MVAHDRDPARSVVGDADGGYLRDETVKQLLPARGKALCEALSTALEEVLGELSDRALRDEAFQLLLTFALVLMFQGGLRYFWGASPKVMGDIATLYGKVEIGALKIPTYNLLVIPASIANAQGIGAFLQKPNYGRIQRDTAENREKDLAIGEPQTAADLLRDLLSDESVKAEPARAAAESQLRALGG